MKRHFCLLVTISLFLLLVATTIHAAFLNPTIGVRQKLLGYSFTGVADDATATLHNPAGLVNLPPNKFILDGQIANSLGGIDFKSYNGNEYTSKADAMIMDDFIAKSYGEYGIGFGFSAPYVEGTFAGDYMDFGNTDLTLSSDGASFHFGFTSAVAYRVTQSLSFGIAGTFYFIHNAYENILHPKGLPSYTYETESNAVYGGWDARIGVLYSVNKNLRIGLTIKPPTTLEYALDAEVYYPLYGYNTLTNTKVDTIEELPLFVALGVGYQIRKNLLAAFDIKYNNGRQYEKETTFSDGQDAGTGTEKGAHMDTFAIGGGIQYGYSDKQDFYFGVAYSPYHVKWEHVHFLNGSNDIISFKIGTGYDLTPRTEIFLLFDGNFILERSVPYSQGQAEATSVFQRGGEFSGFVGVYGFGLKLRL